MVACDPGKAWTMGVWSVLSAVVCQATRAPSIPALAPPITLALLTFPPTPILRTSIDRTHHQGPHTLPRGRPTLRHTLPPISQGLPGWCQGCILDCQLLAYTHSLFTWRSGVMWWVGRQWQLELLSHSLWTWEQKPNWLICESGRIKMVLSTQKQWMCVNLVRHF